MCYLDAAARRRCNLTITASATATRILFDGRRATGVKAQLNGAETEFHGREIILSTGAIFSPAMLMRSGIGPAKQLGALGITVVADLPGVGGNLQNHPVLFIGLHLKRAARQPEELRTVPAIALRYSSGLDGCPPADLYMNVQNKTSWSALGRQIGNIAPTLLRPVSTGHVALTSPDPRVPPRIEFNFLGEEQDLQRMIRVYARGVELVACERVRSLAGTTFPVRFTDRLRLLNERNRANAMKSSLNALALDAVPDMNDLVLGTLTGERIDLEALAADPQRLAEHIKENVGGVFHPTGTCRMGPATDRHAVVDMEGRVHGIAGLRVADAAIMPNVMAGNTNVPTMMVGEKIADAIRAAREG